MGSMIAKDALYLSSGIFEICLADAAYHDLDWHRSPVNNIYSYNPV